MSRKKSDRAIDRQGKPFIFSGTTKKVASSNIKCKRWEKVTDGVYNRKGYNCKFTPDFPDVGKMTNINEAMGECNCNGICECGGTSGGGGQINCEDNCTDWEFQSCGYEDICPTSMLFLTRNCDAWTGCATWDCWPALSGGNCSDDDDAWYDGWEYPSDFLFRSWANENPSAACCMGKGQCKDIPWCPLNYSEGQCNGTLPNPEGLILSELTCCEWSNDVCNEIPCHNWAHYRCTHGGTTPNSPPKVKGNPKYSKNGACCDQPLADTDGNNIGDTCEAGNTNCSQQIGPGQSQACWDNCINNQQLTYYCQSGFWSCNKFPGGEYTSEADCAANCNQIIGTPEQCGYCYYYANQGPGWADSICDTGVGIQGGYPGDPDNNWCSCYGFESPGNTCVGFTSDCCGFAATGTDNTLGPEEPAKRKSRRGGLMNQQDNWGKEGGDGTHGGASWNPGPQGEGKGTSDEGYDSSGTHQDGRPQTCPQYGGFNFYNENGTPILFYQCTQAMVDNILENTTNWEGYGGDSDVQWASNPGWNRSLVSCDNSTANCTSTDVCAPWWVFTSFHIYDPDYEAGYISQPSGDNWWGGQSHCPQYGGSGFSLSHCGCQDDDAWYDGYPLPSGEFLAKSETDLYEDWGSCCTGRGQCKDAPRCPIHYSEGQCDGSLPIMPENVYLGQVDCCDWSSGECEIVDCTNWAHHACTHGGLLLQPRRSGGVWSDGAECCYIEGDTECPSETIFSACLHPNQQTTNQCVDNCFTTWDCIAQGFDGPEGESTNCYTCSCEEFAVHNHFEPRGIDGGGSCVTDSGCNSECDTACQDLSYSYSGEGGDLDGCPPCTHGCVLDNYYRDTWEYDGCYTAGSCCHWQIGNTWCECACYAQFDMCRTYDACKTWQDGTVECATLSTSTTSASVNDAQYKNNPLVRALRSKAKPINRHGLGKAKPIGMNSGGLINKSNNYVKVGDKPAASRKNELMKKNILGSNKCRLVTDPKTCKMKGCNWDFSNDLCK